MNARILRKICSNDDDCIVMNMKIATVLKTVAIGPTNSLNQTWLKVSKYNNTLILLLLVTIKLNDI